MNFAFGELLGDIGKWFLAGLLLAGVIGALLPASFIQNYLGDGFLPMVLVLFIAVPLYVCATASTPIVAALALKGLSPGAAMVFLLAGPATNAASLTVIARVLGKRAATIYLASIIFCSMLIGVAANYLYGMIGLDITNWVAQDHGESHGIAATGFAILLIALVLRSILKDLFNKKDCCHTHTSDHTPGHKRENNEIKPPLTPLTSTKPATLDHSHK